jgi:hypothetical protein
MSVGLKERFLRVVTPPAVLEREGEAQLPPVVTELPGEALRSGDTLRVKGLGVDGQVTVVSPTLGIVGNPLKVSTAGMTRLRDALKAA